MEIYLLREEKQVGPYGADDIRSWLNHGQVSATELAWAPGLESWMPLNTVLEPKAPAEPERMIVKPLPKATAQQKAFLSYMGSSFTAHLTEKDAEQLSAQVSGDPKLAARLVRWQDERLDMYPEMFAKELKARRENRPAHFHKLVQTEGGDCFNGVTKAHCQVLVGYLDVNHPRWDANLQDATWHYFFPAIAEKFPQLVNKAWRPKLKFKDGPKVAVELLDPDITTPTRPRRPLNWKAINQTVAALLLLGLIGGAVYGWLHPAVVPMPLKDQFHSWESGLSALASGNDPVPPAKLPLVKKVVVEGEPSPKADEPATKPDAPARAATDPKPADPTMEPKASDPTMAMAEPKPAAPPMASTEMKPDASAEGMAPAAQPKPTEQLFNPNAPTAAAPTVPVVPNIPGIPPAPPSVAGTRADARLTRAFQIPSKYGTITLNAGTLMKIVTQEGEWITLNYMGTPIRVPVAATDYLR